MKKLNKGNVVKNIKIKIFENFKIKVICFILAIAMYFSIAIFQRNIKTYSADLKITGLKDYLVISTKIPRTVKIIARDKQEVFDKITEEDFNIRLDLSNITGPNWYRIKLEWDVPKTMRSFFSTIKIDPKEIGLNIEKIAEKNVEIIINSIGTPANGYIVKRTTINPPSVRIQGPKSLINKIKSVKTETINIEGVKESFKRQVRLISNYSAIKVLGKTDLYFEIIEETDEVAFRFYKVYFQNLKKQFKAKIKESILVTLRGPKNSIPNISKDDFALIVDCANIAFPGEYTYNINVEKPENFEVVSKFPERIIVIVEDN